MPLYNFLMKKGKSKEKSKEFYQHFLNNSLKEAK